MLALFALAQEQDRLGTIPDWIAALGTAFAFFVALGLLAKELAARREQDEDRRRDQARRISAWTTRPEPERHGSPNFAFYILIRNGSEEPIHAVRARMVARNSPHARDPLAGPPEVGALTVEPDRVPPGETFSHRQPMVPTMPGPLGLAFTDAAGRRWTRYPDGRLVEQGRRRRSRKDYLNAWIAGELDRLD